MEQVEEHDPIYDIIVRMTKNRQAIEKNRDEKIRLEREESSLRRELGKLVDSKRGGGRKKQIVLYGSKIYLLSPTYQNNEWRVEEVELNRL